MSTFTEDTNPINIYTNEAVQWFAGNTLTLMNYTGSPGVVESIQFSTSNKDYNPTLSVQIDNYPLITCDALAFFGFTLDPNASAQTQLVMSWNTNILGGINNKNYIASNGQGFGCTKRVFIPFTLNITITVSDNNMNDIVNSQVTYRKWPSAFPLYYSVGERRKYWHVLQAGSWMNPIFLTAYGTYNTASITGRGQIEFITHIVWNVNPAVQGDTTCRPITCLEGACTMNIDGNVQTIPSTDMFWGGLNYWQNGKTVANSPDCGLFTWCSSTLHDQFNMQAYKFCYDKTIFFNQSFSFGWTYGDSTYSTFGQGVGSCSNIFLISYWLESLS